VHHLRTEVYRDGVVRPLRLALIDDYDVVIAGVAHMFDSYRDRVEIVEMVAGEPVSVDVDVALFDTFAQAEADGLNLATIIENPHARRVVVYTWSFDEQLIERALAQGASGYLAKTLPAAELVVALERVNAGEVVVSESPPRSRRTIGLDWPGRVEGLSDREAEVLALIAQAKTNAQIAALTYLSENTVKSYTQSLYRKLGVSSRTQAALWGVNHGFAIEGHRTDDWA